MSDPAAWVEQRFPMLVNTPYSLESPVDLEYNCIAFAAGETDRWWWPPGPFPGGTYWPLDVPNEVTLAAFVAAFESLGYEVCGGGDPEAGVEKVAIFTLAGEPTHAARQIPGTSRWLSKLGQAFDIWHEGADAVQNATYGDVALYLSRPVADK